MYRRIATLLLALLTIGFFIFHHLHRQQQIKFVDTIAPARISSVTIAKDEFLILMNEGEERHVNEVLRQFDLKLMQPLCEWMHVARNGAEKMQHVIPLSSINAQENLAFLKKLEEHELIHSAHLNYVQIKEASACVPKINFGFNASTSDGLVIPHDPFFRYQWYLSKELGMDLPGAWNITKGNRSTMIALVDRNFDFKEEDLSPEHCSSRQYYYENVLDYFPQTVPKLPKDNQKHGGDVLSVVAPCTDNEVGIAGIDWHAQVFAVDTERDASFAARMFALLWAAGVDVCTKSITGCPENSRFQKNMHPANIINASFGFADQFLQDPPYGPVLDVIGRINRQGRIIVASAGNEGIMSDRRLPGSAGGVISVGSSGKQKKSSGFSNFGRTVDVVAPGEEIVGLRKGKPVSLNGTSFSSPLVTGVASLMLAANPMLSWKHIENILKTTATKMTCADYCSDAMNASSRNTCETYCCDDDGRVVCAAGIVNAYEAVKTAYLGIPDKALIDVDDYFLALSEESDLKARVLVKNWGKKAAVVRMKKTNRHLHLVPEIMTVSPIDKNGVPGMKDATVFFDALPHRHVVTSLVLEGANADQPSVFHDRIEAIVEIVPDPRAIRKKKALKELLPK